MCRSDELANTFHSKVPASRAERRFPESERTIQVALGLFL